VSDHKPVDVAAIQARWAKASPWPWAAKPHRMRRDCRTVQTTDGHETHVAHYLTPEDADAIAHAPEDIDALLRENHHLREQIAGLTSTSSTTGRP
jgi:hypothetical protein